MPRIAVQYLENGPGVEDISPREARAKLQAAFALLPIDDIVLGWNLPSELVEVCREVATETGANLFLWHPFLSGDGVFVPRQEWQTIGLRGEAVPGFRQMPEFTFVCPNRPAVRDAVLAHLQSCMRSNYDGVFLDRMRFPAPTADPSRLLACFCEDCRRAASAEGLDLVAARKGIRRLLNSRSGARTFLRILLGKGLADSTNPDIVLLARFLDFRIRSINRIVVAAAELIHAAGLQVALDCFAPSLMRMVGQDLEALDPWCDWSKIMVYGHAFGPAGLPFELTELASWLVETYMMDESEALAWLSEATGLRLPNSLASLCKHGLPSASLKVEYGKAPNLGADRLAVGIELVEIAGITELHAAQIEADLHAFRKAGAEGMVLSWDLWHMSPERLQLIRDVWVTEVGPTS